LEVNRTEIGIKLPVDIVYCVAYRKVFTPTRNALDFVKVKLTLNTLLVLFHERS